jgi:hypothetical protein
MRNRALNIAFMVLGALALFLSTRSLLHHEYEYFDKLRQSWISTFFLLVCGVWCFLFGLIGLIRAKPGNEPD